MASFVENYCFVYVNGLRPRRGSFVVGSFCSSWDPSFGCAGAVFERRAVVACLWNDLLFELANFARGVLIFAVVSQGASQERRLVHHAVSIWPTCGLEQYSLGHHGSFVRL